MDAPAGTPVFPQVAIAASALVLALSGNAAADIDLTGRWHMGSGTYAQIVQTGEQVTVQWTQDFGGGPMPVELAGTFDQAVLAASQPGMFSMSAFPYGDGDMLDGTLSALFTFSPNYSHRNFTRCECYDGNTLPGDGCDPECQVEPCYSCTPEPSTCTPSADGAACDDRDDCTTGETCAAGACGDGSPLSPCVNLTGLWREVVEIPDFDFRSVFNQEYRQRDGVLRAGPGGAVPTAVGSIDPATGAMDLLARGGSGWCSSSWSSTGTASLDNQSFAGTGSANASTPRFCLGFTRTVRGVRCDEEGGCDLSDCSGLADGTACVDEDPCTTDETCRGGVCSGGPLCPACTTCDGGACVAGPLPDCRRTLSSSSSTLQVTNDPGDDSKDSIRWNWKKGEATTVADFGAPGASDVTLCVFGEAGTTPELVYSKELASSTPCRKPPCWSGDARSVKYHGHEDDGGIVSLVLRSGEAGKSRIQLRGKGLLLSYPLLLAPIPMQAPLRTQLQTSSGGCFEAEFDASGVSRNADGVFKAGGGTLSVP